MTYTSKQRLYVNADRSKIVDEDSSDAAYLLVGEGGEIPDEEAERYGLHDEAKAEEAPEAPEAKAVELAPSNKAQRRSEDK